MIHCETQNRTTPKHVFRNRVREWEEPTAVKESPQKSPKTRTLPQNSAKGTNAERSPVQLHLNKSHPSFKNPSEYLGRNLHDIRRNPNELKGQLQLKPQNSQTPSPTSNQTRATVTANFSPFRSWKEAHLGLHERSRRHGIERRPAAGSRVKVTQVRWWVQLPKNWVAWQTGHGRRGAVDERRRWPSMWIVIPSI